MIWPMMFAPAWIGALSAFVKVLPVIVGTMPVEDKNRPFPMVELVTERADVVLVEYRPYLLAVLTMDTVQLEMIGDPLP